MSEKRGVKKNKYRKRDICGGVQVEDRVHHHVEVSIVYCLSSLEQRTAMNSPQHIAFSHNSFAELTNREYTDTVILYICISQNYCVSLASSATIPFASPILHYTHRQTNK